MSDTELRARLTVLDALITYTAESADALYARAEALRREYVEVCALLRTLDALSEEEL